MIVMDRLIGSRKEINTLDFFKRKNSKGTISKLSIKILTQFVFISLVL